MEKLTKIQKFEMILAVKEIEENEVLRDFVAKEIENLKAKAEKAKTNKKSKISNESLTEILEVLEGVENPKSIEEIKEALGNPEISSQAMSARLKKLVDSGLAGKVKKAKKMAYYKEGE